jgi:hypothetical protein
MKQDTNNPPEESPVDALFARRLGQHSIAPPKAGWERLQARVSGQPETRVLLFWQNPVTYRYAAAACVMALLLAGGWLLLGPRSSALMPENELATSVKNKNRANGFTKKQPRQQQTQPINQAEELAQKQMPQPTLGVLNQKQKPIYPNANGALTVRKTTQQKPGTQLAIINQAEQNAAKTELKFDEPKPIQLAKTEIRPSSASAISPQTKLVSEQVLVVTIAEPDALIEARQAANWSESAEKTLVVEVAKQPTKGRKLLDQLKRVRDGEGLELAGNDDQSLLSRAFQTIKNKTNNKPIKQ